MSPNHVMSPFTMALVLAGMRTQLVTGGAAKVKLFQNNFTPTNQSVIADFTEATFDGYAAGSTSWVSGPFRNADGSFSVAGSSTWAMTGAVTPNIIYGCYVLDFAGANLLFANLFDVPVTMVDAFSALQIRHELQLPVNGILRGGAVVP